MNSRDQEFESFFLEHFEQLVNSLTVITGDRDRATDAVQEAFIKTYARWPKVREFDLPVGWVRRIAINASRDTRRSERRRARREKPHLTPPAPSSSNDVVGLDFAQRLLAELPRRQREVATLFYLDDCSVDEIARTLNLSPGTVKSHLAMARERLRDLLGQTECAVNDDLNDLFRSAAAAGGDRPSDVRATLDALKPAMRRARRRRHVAVGSAGVATTLISIVGVVALASVLGADPAIRPVAPAGVTLPSIDDHDSVIPVRTTVVDDDHEYSPEESTPVSSDEPGVEKSVVSTPETSTSTTDATPLNGEAAAPDAPGPRSTAPPPSSASPPIVAPDPPPATGPATTGPIAASTTTTAAPTTTSRPTQTPASPTVVIVSEHTIFCSCGSITVSADAYSAHLHGINPAAGFSVDVKADGPEVEVGFIGSDRECEIKVETENGQLNVDVDDD